MKPWTFDSPYVMYSMNDIFFCVLYNIFCNHHPIFSYQIQYFPPSAIHLRCSYFGFFKWICMTGIAVPDWREWKRKCKEMWNFCQKEAYKTLELSVNICSMGMIETNVRTLRFSIWMWPQQSVVSLFPGHAFSTNNLLYTG
jgi:DMSO/TMAO reductase YedYZ heme-binding membrane subunit